MHSLPSLRVMSPVMLLLLWLLGLPSVAAAQSSEALARELVALLESQKRDSIAAADPQDEERFMAVLLLPGIQLIAVGAQYPAPTLLADKLERQEYRNVYIDLQSASPADTRVQIEDLGNDGLRPRPDSGGADMYDVGGRRVIFNGDRRSQGLSSEEYDKAFADAESEYIRLLTHLVESAKKATQ